MTYFTWWTAEKFKSLIVFNRPVPHHYAELWRKNIKFKIVCNDYKSALFFVEENSEKEKKLKWFLWESFGGMKSHSEKSNNGFLPDSSVKMLSDRCLPAKWCSFFPCMSSQRTVLMLRKVFLKLKKAEVWWSHTAS